MSYQADISETVFFQQYPEILETLLKDHTTQKNIFFFFGLLTVMPT